MSDEKISLDMWERAKGMFLMSLRTPEERSQAERHFDMITKVIPREGTLEIYTLNDFAVDVLSRKYAAQLRGSLVVLGAPEDVQVEFLADKDIEQTIKIVEPIEPVKVVKKQEEEKYVSTMPLTESYTFEEFVTGPSNSWAYAAAKGAAEHPGEKSYNPLFIYGGTGLGKTHLMQSIGNEILRKNPRLRVCYLTAEEFLNEYVNTLKAGLIESFREKYRKVDVLLVDDVQFLQKGKLCQEEFFNTFNALTSKRKQIVMTSDVAPKNMPQMEARLISRFEGGMLQEIELPSYETRLAILRKKAESIHPMMSDETLKFIAQKIKSHVRAMEGALSKVNVMMKMDATIPINEDTLTHLLRDFIEKEKTQKNITIEKIQSVVAAFYHISLTQLLSAERTSSLVTPRQLAMYIAKKFTSKSLVEIAAKFEKSHATILHGVKTIKKRLDVEDELKNELEKIIAELGYSMSDTID
jgi:chromosomal replication initiator protein